VWTSPKYLEVLYPVVQRVSVYVMNVLVCAELPAKILLYNPTMGTYFPPIPPN